MRYTALAVHSTFCVTALVLTVCPALAQNESGTSDLFVTVGKSLIMDSPVQVDRVSLGSPEIAEAIAVNPREILIHGRAPGETTFVIWQKGGNRLVFDLHVRPSNSRVDAVQRELDKELGKGIATVNLEDQNVFIRGTVNDLTAADRAVTIASTIGKPVNLLNVKVPDVDPQILLKVTFASVDRAASQELGANLLSIGGLNTVGSISTQQFNAPRPDTISGSQSSVFRLSDALNVLLWRPDINLGATIKALESKRLLQVLAEPNVLTSNGKPASFLAGGEFPYPTLQGGGGGLGAVTIQFREFGVRINFTPTVTPRNTIRLHVTPEVSSLDFANGLVFQGFTIPGLNTRRVSTEIELEQNQSFAIGGLLDNRVTEAMSKIPGLGDIPFFGKLFRSRLLNKTNSELLVIVTPEFVRPIPAGNPLPALNLPAKPLKDSSTTMPRTPNIAQTGPVPVKPAVESMPVEDLVNSLKGKAAPQQPTTGYPGVQFVPVMPMPVPQAQPAPGPAQTPAPKPPGQ